ncbi:MAG: PDDEXK nuclease domain-containing protein [Bacteroidales bacterium]|nr:PDDEXK nuclease domain-containing protein [Bacteroidales bacterium]
MDKNSIATIDFRQIHEIISFRRSRALLTVNHENLLSAWEVGAFVSERLQNSAWGSKTVMQLSEYLRTQDPTLRGYSRRNIYNMVLLYDTYSSLQFAQYQEKLNLGQIIQFQTGQIVQFQTAQFPNFLNLTTLTNHFEILNACKTVEERVFYVLYSHKEQLSIKELKRCIKNDAYSSVLGEKQGFSKGLKDTYPQAVPMLKDTLQVGFLELPKKHSEKRLQKGILDNMKDFVLELGKDFLFVDKEYALQVGNSTFKLDLLFYHRGLQCLVAIELKTGKFKPEYMGQLEFYLEALDRDVRHSNENPSIGILLCQETDRSVVEYAMSRSLSPTMIAKYERLFIPKEILQRSLGEFIHFLNPQEQFAQKGIN